MLRVKGIFRLPSKGSPITFMLLRVQYTVIEGVVYKWSRMKVYCTSIFLRDNVVDGLAHKGVVGRVVPKSVISCNW